MRVQATWLAVLLGCGTPAAVETDEEGFDPFTSPAGTGDADSDADADADADSDADADDDADSDAGDGSDGSAGDCDDYRTEYPSGPYGNTPGAVIADLPGMVSPTGAAMSLIDVFQDRTKQVLVIANAFDT